MKLDVNVLRYLSKDEFRVLTAVEIGQKNHEIVPVQLVDSISGLKHGGTYRCIKTLLRHKLLHHDASTYDGYRLTYMGYDFLAIKAMVNRGHISGVGRQIGMGKESDIYEATNDDGEVFALKLHRLGRTSFRAVKSKRDYLGKRTSYSWLYLSRLAAVKEYAFMKALGDHGFPVPQAVDSNRHAVLMQLIDAHPLVQVSKLGDPGKVYLQAMELISQLAGKGLIHCDFNEFNLLVSDEEDLTLIDFPQMVSTSHANAEEYFSRDVECIVRFFEKKVGYMPDRDPSLPYVRPDFASVAASALDDKLDVELAASGFQRHHQAQLEEAMRGVGEEEGEDEDEEGEEEEEEGVSGAGNEGEGEDGERQQQSGVGALRADKDGGSGSDEGKGEKEGAEPGGSGSEVEEPQGRRQQRRAAAALRHRSRGNADEAGGSGGEEGEDGEAAGQSGSASEGEDARHDDGEKDGQAGAGGARKGGAGAASVLGVMPEMEERDVQARLNAQRRRQGQRAALSSRSTRNTNKLRAKGGKGGKASNAGADFGGW